jgi:hypothetical protein
MRITQAIRMDCSKAKTGPLATEAAVVRKTGQNPLI